MKVTFPKFKSTDRFSYLQKDSWDIKVDGKEVGQIYSRNKSNKNDCYWVISENKELNLPYINNHECSLPLDLCKKEAKEYIKKHCLAKNV